LATAIHTGNERLIRFFLESGAKFTYECKTVSVAGSPVSALATIVEAIAAPGGPRPEVLQLLVNEYKVLENWQLKYSEETKGHISSAIATLAIVTVPPNPRYAGRPPLPYQPSNAKCLDIVFSTGFNYSFMPNGTNSVINALGTADEADRLVVTPEHGLTLLKRFKALGFNVTDTYKKDVGTGNGFNLSFTSIQAGQPLGSTLLYPRAAVLWTLFWK
jgi:hypothetical protein